MGLGMTKRGRGPFVLPVGVSVLTIVECCRYEMDNARKRKEKNK